MLKKLGFTLIILILFISCKNNYSTKIINEKNYIHIFDQFYYQIDTHHNPINHYYKSQIKNLQWAKFNYTIDDFANLKIYLSKEKIDKQNLKIIKNDFDNQILNYFFTPQKEYQIEQYEQLNKVKHLSVIYHQPATKRVQPLDDGWKKGYLWETKGASSEISIFFIYKKAVINYIITLEYLPQIKSDKNAQKIYEEKKDQIVQIIKNLYFKL